MILTIKISNFPCKSKLLYIGTRLYVRGDDELSHIDELEQIMEQYTEYLIRIAYYYVKDLHVAEDIVQDVFIKFHQSTIYEDRGQLKAYLTRVVINKSKDYLKSWTYRKVQLQNKLLVKEIRTKSDSLIRKEEQELIGEAIMQLPLKQREILIYFYFEEMTIAEITKLLAIPESTVKTRIRRGKELLRPQLNAIEWEVLLNE